MTGFCYLIVVGILCLVLGLLCIILFDLSSVTQGNFCIFRGLVEFWGVQILNFYSFFFFRKMNIDQNFVDIFGGSSLTVENEIIFWGYAKNSSILGACLILWG